MPFVRARLSVTGKLPGLLWSPRGVTVSGRSLYITLYNGVAVVRDFLGAAPQNNRVQGNVLLRNQPDLFWDGSGSGNVFRGNICQSTDPAGLCSH